MWHGHVEINVLTIFHKPQILLTFEISIFEMNKLGEQSLFEPVSVSADCYLLVLPVPADTLLGKKKKKVDIGTAGNVSSSFI